MPSIPTLATVPLWSRFEASFDGRGIGNPHRDVALRARFTSGARSVEVDGFYDGDGVFRVRHMPDAEGEWRFTTTSNVASLDGLTGGFRTTAPEAGAHGPVRVRDGFHFAHADGTPYVPFGTTCYAWTHQDEAMQAETLATLRTAPFNKIRMAIFPKHYIYSENEPLHAMFERGPDGTEDRDRPNPVAFRLLEARIDALAALGIEADLILFHPYDRWGYCDMSHEQDLAYVRHVLARLASFRNVWWSLANEYDFLLDVKPLAHWHAIGNLIAARDPGRHLVSIHNGEATMDFDHTAPWITHVCLQNWDVKRTSAWRRRWGKPIVNDELEYEGDIPRPWGNISARELVHRFWITVVSGGYAGHGECYLHADDLLWWAKGGVLRGSSTARIGFLRRLIEADCPHGLTPLAEEGRWEWSRVSGGRDGDVRFLYFGEHQPAHWAIGLPMTEGDWEIDLIDTWEMTVTPLEPAALPHSPALRQRGGAIVGGAPEAGFGIRLPGKPYQAVRIRPRRRA